MNPYLKVAAVTLCALIIAMFASKYVQLSSTEALRDLGSGKALDHMDLLREVTIS